MSDGLTSTGRDKRTSDLDERGQAAAIAAQIEKLRTKLLDLTTRNPLIAFKHNARSRRVARIIDEVPDQLYTKLQSESGVLRFRSLGDAEDELADEKTINFRRALDAAKLSDAEYLRKVVELGEDPGEKGLAQLEEELRIQLRERLSEQPSGVSTPRQGR